MLVTRRFLDLVTPLHIRLSKDERRHIEWSQCLHCIWLFMWNQGLPPAGRTSHTLLDLNSVNCSVLETVWLTWQWEILVKCRYKRECGSVEALYAWLLYGDGEQLVDLVSIIAAIRSMHSGILGGSVKVLLSCACWFSLDGCCKHSWNQDVDVHGDLYLVLPYPVYTWWSGDARDAILLCIWWW